MSPAQNKRSRGKMPSTLWIEAKKDLIQNYRFGWLSTFDRDVPIADDVLFESIKDLDGARPQYDPYQLEGLLSASSALLDRCLNQRRDLQNLEEQAVRRGLEYKLFIDQLPYLTKIELAANLEEQRAIEKAGHEKAAKAFAGSEEATPSGLAAISKASAKSLEIARLAEIERKANVQQKWDAAEYYQQALEARHKTLGHALNYEDRANRISRFLARDAAIAYNKLRCIEVGANKIFGLNCKLERPTKANRLGYLDYMVEFHREVIDKIDIATVEEIEFEHVVSLRQPMVRQGEADDIAIDDSTWQGVLKLEGDGVLSVDLEKRFPKTIGRLRVKAVGLTWISEQGTVPEHRLRSTSAVIFPPAQADLFTRRVELERPPIVIEKIQHFDPNSATRLVASPSVINIDPREGSKTWRILMSSNLMITNDPHQPHSRAPEQILEVKLHLKVAAVITGKTPEEGWSEFSW